MKAHLEELLFPRPPILHFEVEDRCNMACPMCITRAHRSGRHGRLSLDEVKRLVLARFRFAGGSHVLFSGGEPTLADDLEEILAYAVRIGLKFSLFTNLYRIEADRMRKILDLLSASGNRMDFSYDSIVPEEMEIIRGVADAHASVTANLETLLRMNGEYTTPVRIRASLVLQGANSRSVADTLRYLRGLALDSVIVQPVNRFGGNGDEDGFPMALPPCRPEELPALLEATETVFRMAGQDNRIRLCHPDADRWHRHFSEPGRQRHACRSDRFLFVSRRGDYFGCHYSVACGNVRETGPVEFLRSDPYVRHRRLMTRCNACTQGCC